MKSRNLKELMNAVLEKTGRNHIIDEDIDNDDLTQDQHMVLGMINGIQEEIQQDYPWMITDKEAEFQTEDGTVDYTLTGQSDRFPVDFYKIRWLKLPGKPENRELDMVNAADFHRLSDHANTNGTPSHWRLKTVNDREEPIISLYPTPDGKHTVLYSYGFDVPKLEFSDDKTPFPDQAVIWGAIRDVKDYDGDDFQLAHQKYLVALQSQREQDDGGLDVQWGKHATKRSISRSQQRQPGLHPNFEIDA